MYIKTFLKSGCQVWFFCFFAVLLKTPSKFFEKINRKKNLLPQDRKSQRRRYHKLAFAKGPRNNEIVKLRKQEKGRSFLCAQFVDVFYQFQTGHKIISMLGEISIKVKPMLLLKEQSYRNRESNQTFSFYKTYNKKVMVTF